MHDFIAMATFNFITLLSLPSYPTSYPGGLEVSIQLAELRGFPLDGHGGIDRELKGERERARGARENERERGGGGSFLFPLCAVVRYGIPR